jgi:hypothetical protein
MSIKPTGYCWNCGRVCEGLFCNEKHKAQWEKKQSTGAFGKGGRSVRNGKRDGYGLAGSTH